MHLNKLKMTSKIYCSHRVLAISGKNPRLPMARRYIDNIEIVDSFDAIPWTDILLR